jgi:hypothetical protein
MTTGPSIRRERSVTAGAASSVEVRLAVPMAT